MTPDPRPPSILSEHGEGYCRFCQFVVGLISTGELQPHSRNVLVSPRECEGSYKKPPKVTPYYSRKAAFRTLAHKEVCPVEGCGRQVAVMTDGRFMGHTLPYSYIYCKGGYQMAPSRRA